MPDPPQIQPKRLKCLWLTRIDPREPDAGDLYYSLHLLSSLGKSGVEVTVLAVARAIDCTPVPIADGIEWRLIAPKKGAELRGRLALRCLFSRLPNVAVQYKTMAFQRELRIQLKREWDAIVIDHLGMGWAWPLIEAYQARNSGAISVFIAHQCEGDVRRNLARNFRGNVLRKIGLHVDALKAGMLEREIVRKSTLFSAITAEDRDRLGASAKSVLLTPGYAGVHAGVREITAATPRRALMFGSAVWLAKQMNLSEFIAVADELFWHNQIELWVVGKVADSLRIRNHHRATHFLGFVEDPEPIFRNVRIGIIAERTGGGFKLKSLDYIFKRVPIAAIRGGIAGLPLTPQLDYLSFDSLNELARGVAAVIDNFERLNNLKETAFAKCSAAFEWSERGRTLLAAMQRAVHRAPS